MRFDRRAAMENFRRGVDQIDRGDAFPLAKVLLLPPVSPEATSSNKKKGGNNNQQLRSENGTDWSGVLNAWLDACAAAHVGEAVECYESQATLHSTFNQLFASSAGNTLVPALHAVCKSTHRTAIVADDQAASRDHAKMNNAATLLQESFSKTFNDRKELIPDTPYCEEGSKKAGVLGIVNELFRIYFYLNTLRLCKNLVKPVEARKLHLQGSMGQRVTYKYFTGRLSLFEDNYPDAEANLEYAFQNCHKNAVKNKRSILRYLIPVKIYRGRLPSASLLEKYQLDEFALLVASIRKGDLKTFNKSLLENQHRFIRQGTFLLLEKCRLVCYRSLFMRMHNVVNTHLLPLDQVITVFNWLDIHIDLDEVECILANLIYRGIIRGYLHHSKRILVLSKRDPFPAAALVGN